MLSYNHIFHAGNHADVIKHLCWLNVISYLKNKDKPFTLFDTHAGAGVYALDSVQAQKNSEFKSGISTVIGSHFSSPLLQQYQDLCSSFLHDNLYPGSPILAAELLRHQDTLQVMELHPNEVINLKRALKSHAGNKQTYVHHRDGLEGLLALAPPSTKRGAVLIDPPYEKKEEYQAVLKCVSSTLHKWRTAQIIIWYPLLSQRAKEKTGLSEQMVAKMNNLGFETLTAELVVDAKSNDCGMYGSGVCVINPCWTLENDLSQALTEFCQLTPSAFSRITWHNKQ
ncbi:23S rRNA (adenine(2030)-N(6))-methyltransferase RlmJ [Alteromonas ponticola]|uniref:Ribosomal RNA large subunit methyltransferase J n=1 Tax=Alteromonas aquimaris TaxID=2998417 RepID=A0ABT3P6R9_9ALTE|nr:23S rRNA (adenine(2030)-N(6))-methyltransferase RlmJ [Alteromonas aquimaris]MCW8108467.1 23S rRNA (adenine(2030)-N(6))-methyltransferase RlmJ [Alteromonas aquimaris]